MAYQKRRGRERGPVLSRPLLWLNGGLSHNAAVCAASLSRKSLPLPAPFFRHSFAGPSCLLHRPSSGNRGLSSCCLSQLQQQSIDQAFQLLPNSLRGVVQFSRLLLRRFLQLLHQALVDPEAPTDVLQLFAISQLQRRWLIGKLALQQPHCSRQFLHFAQRMIQASFLDGHNRPPHKPTASGLPLESLHSHQGQTAFHAEMKNHAENKGVIRSWRRS